MARPIDSTLAKRIIQAHKSILIDLSRAINLRNTLRQDIIDASHKMIVQETLQVLEEIPIEEINRDKRGFRIKALKDHGYRSIADISTASVYSIASIYGISEDTAYAIKDVVNDIVAKANQNSKVRLSEDKKTKEATQLVLAIAKYKACDVYIEECEHLYKNAHTILGKMLIASNLGG